MANQDISEQFGYSNQGGIDTDGGYVACTRLDLSDIRSMQKSELESRKFFLDAKNYSYFYSNDNGIQDGYQLLDPVDRYYLNSPYLKNKYAFLTSKDPYSLLNNGLTVNEIHAINAEKGRIADQKASTDYTRDDHFAIGTVYLRIPPTQINVSEDSHNYRYSTLRSPGETVFTSGRTTTRIELDIVFTGLDDINNKLRPLIAQLKTTPFLPIENNYLRRILNPYNAKLVDDNFMKNLQSQKLTMQQASENVDRMLEYSSQKDAKDLEILDLLSDLRDYIPNFDTDKDVWLTRIKDPNTISKGELEEGDIIRNRFGTERVDLSKWIKKQLNVEGKGDVDFVTITRNLNEISTVQDEIDAIQKKLNDFGNEMKNERFADRQLAVVLSQISLSVSPGFPDTIQCHLSLYLFTYDPFSIDFAFLSGYNDNKATPDITKCTFFIDWYTKRFLTENKSVDKPSLGEYSVNNDVSFSYFKNLTPVSKRVTYDDLKNLVQVETFKSGDGFYPVGITVSMKNVIQFIPILSSKNPTCQYMGSMNTDVIMNFECTDQSKLTEFYKMVNRIRSISRSMNRTTRNNFIYIKNSLLDFLGMPYFMIGDTTVDTVPGNPGLFSVSLSLMEYKMGQQDMEKLKRENVMAAQDVASACEFIIDKAYEYKKGANDAKKNYEDAVIVAVRAGGKRSDVKESDYPNTSAYLEPYYNIVVKGTKDNVAWLSPSGDDMVNSFMTGVGAGSKNEELRQKILQNSPDAKLGVITKRVTSATNDAIREATGRIGAYGAARSIGSMITSMMSSKMSVYHPNEETYTIKDWSDFSSWFILSIERSDDVHKRYFDTWKSTMVQIASIVQRPQVVKMIYDPSFSDLNEMLNGKRSQDDIDLGKIYCYPDLELPRYSELPNGFKLKNKNSDIGRSSLKGEENRSIQSNYSVVDPDFYFYKGSLWKDIDNDNPAAISVANGIKVFKELANSNSGYRATGAPNEDDMMSILSDTYSEQQRNRSANNRTKYMSQEEVNKYSMKPIPGSSIEVYDGDTYTCVIDGRTFRIREEGYDAPETRNSPNDNKKADEENAKPVRNQYIRFLKEKRNGIEPIVFVQFSGAMDGDRNMGRTLVSYDGGKTLERIAPKMIEMFGAERKVTPWKDTTNKLNEDYERAFLKSNEIFVYNMIHTKKNDPRRKKPASYWYSIVKDVSSVSSSIYLNPTGLFGQIGVNVGAGLAGAGVGMAGAFGRSIGNILRGTKQNAAAVATTETALVIGSVMSTVFDTLNDLSPVGRQNWLSNDPDTIISKKLTSDAYTPNNNYNRFDREGDSQIDLISKRIRDSQKNDTLRMSRAFPTFKFYFMEEDSPTWNRLDDFYSYQAVNSIEITKSRTDPADLAIVTLMNTIGTLDKEQFGLYDDSGMFVQRGPEESLRLPDQETRAEQDLQNFILKPGTIIKIKMGYHSDPDLLDDVFMGMVSEVSGGDMINIVAQGFGVELLHNVEKNMYWTEVASAYKILHQAITSPETSHFGKVEWFPEESQQTVKLFRRSVYDNIQKKWVGAAWWRNIGDIRYILGLADNQKDNNIFHPENSWAHNMTFGGNQAFITQGKTIWDVFREMQIRSPGYITTVLPYDNRATIYYGPAEFLYYYTDPKNFASGRWKDAYDRDIDKSDDKKIQDLYDSGYIEVNKEQADRVFAEVSSFLTKQLNSNETDERFKGLLRGTMLYMKNNASKKDTIDENNYKLAVGSLSAAEAMMGNQAGVKEILSLGAEYGYKVTSNFYSQGFFQNGVRALITSKDENDIKLSKSLDFISKHIDMKANPLFSGSLPTGGGNKEACKIEYLSNESLIMDKQGNYLTKKEALKRWEETRYGQWMADDPTRKLVRQYHFKDSIHHIVANSIVATDSYLYNKVTVEFGSEAAWKAKALLEGTSAFGRVSAQVDDDIWPEKVKEKVVQERNAREIVTAWNYALGHLWEEFRKMYTGHLTILGDASIRPYDIIMFSDYFTEMFGPIEVEQVTHHFSAETGFITTIVPNLVCHVNNSLQQGSLTVAGTYMDSVTELVQKVRTMSTGGLPIPIIGNAAANVAFWMTGLSSGRREPISFTPLAYAGRPYVAGVQGLKRNSLVEAIRGNIARFIVQKERIVDAVTNSADYLRIKAREYNP